LGGHTVRDPEIKFGYSVTGAIDPARVLTNAGAKAGDVLFLTKPLGTGIVGTAIKFERAPDALASEATQSMRMLNRAAAEALRTLPVGAVHACTDVTGFGLIGHGSEMAAASGVALQIDAERVPLFSGVLALAAANRSGGMTSNLEHFAGRAAIGRGVSDELEMALYDPQTSGGLLVAVSPRAAAQCRETFRSHAITAYEIGTVAPSVRGVLVTAETSD
jgi:selenide,water dikinase